MQSDTLEERDAIKFCIKLEKNATETYENSSDWFWSILHELSISFWVAYEIQGKQGVCKGWWEVWEELGSQYTRVDWPKG